MAARGSRIGAGLLWLALASTASAEDVPDAEAAPDTTRREVEQVIYKGVIGNVLDAVPMDPEKRVNLQRANAVVSNTASGRSLSVLIGLSNPLLMIGGLLWGLWSASNIDAEAVNVDLARNPPGAGDSREALEPPVSAIETLLAESDPAAATPDALD